MTNVPTNPMPRLPSATAAPEHGGRMRSLAVWSTTTGAMLALVYTRLLLGDVILSRDTARMVYPMKVFFVDSIRRGELPLWYPYEALGTPFLGAAVTAVFHPLSWIAVAFGPLAGHAMATLLTVVILSGGAWVLTRRVGGDRLAASVAVVMAVGGGSALSMLDNQTFAWGASAFPWFIYGVHRSQEEHAGPGIAWAGAAVAWALLAGDVQAVVIMALFGLPASVVWGRVPRIRAVGRLALAGLTGAALAAVQLTASIPVFLASARSGGVSFHESVIWSLHPLRLPELFLGDLLRHDPQTAAGIGGLLGLGDRSPWQLSVYIGPLAIAGLLGAVRLKGRRQTSALLLGGLAAAALSLALGQHGGLWWIFRETVPMWDGFRYPEKLLPFAQLLLAPVVGMGLAHTVRSPKFGARVASVAAGSLFLASLALYAGAGAWDGLEAEWLSRASVGAVRTGVLTALLGTLLFLQHRGLFRNARLIAVAVLMIVAADLTGQHGRLIALMSGPRGALWIDSPVAGRILRETPGGPGAYRVTTYFERQIGVVLDGVQDPGFIGVSLWGRAALQPDHNALFHLPATTFYLPGIDSRLLRMVAGDASSELLNHAPTFSSRYFVFNTEMVRSRGIRPELVMEEWEGLGISLVRRSDALPRLYLAQPESVQNGEAALERLGHTDVRSGLVALVEGPTLATASPTIREGDAGTVDVVRYRSRFIEAYVDSRRDAVLVHTDTWSPGWRCTLDGLSVPILRANYLVRAIEVPKGRHHLVCDMPTPPSLLLGGGVSFLSAAFLPILALRRR